MSFCDRFEDPALRAMRDANIPGLAMATVSANDSTNCCGWGLARRREPSPVTVDTPFLVASVSKPVVAAVIAGLAERRMLAFDEAIDQYLPRPFRNPAFPEQAITLRMLLGHRASLADEPSDVHSTSTYSVGDHPTPLGRWLTNYFGLDGSHLPRGHGAERPNTDVLYSDIGYAMAAWIAELAARMPFDEIARALVFRPLGMTHSGFRLRDVLSAFPAVPYVGPVDSPLRPVQHYGYPFYPAGTLRTSVADLARFIRGLLNDGSVDGKEWLSPATVHEMLPLEGPGLGWARFPHIGRFVKGHEGGDLGAGARVTLDLERRVGILVLGNSEWTASPIRSNAVAELEAIALSADGNA